MILAVANVDRALEIDRDSMRAIHLDFGGRLALLIPTTRRSSARERRHGLSLGIVKTNRVVLGIDYGDPTVGRQGEAACSAWTGRCLMIRTSSFSSLARTTCCAAFRRISHGPIWMR